MDIEKGKTFKTIDYTHGYARTAWWEKMHAVSVLVDVGDRQLRGHSTAHSAFDAYTTALFDTLAVQFPQLKRVGSPRVIVGQGSEPYTALSFPVGSERIVVRKEGNLSTDRLTNLVDEGLNIAIRKFA